MDIWLSRKVFEWSNVAHGGTLIEGARVNRPYAILTHCEGILGENPTEFSVADAVLGLKRAINSRLQHIEELFQFSALYPKSVGALERLEQLGLARPFLVRQLFELRNDIEHNDAQPPDLHRVRELVDLTWYFLRTTDNACKLLPAGVLLRSGDEGSVPPEQWISIRPSRSQPRSFDVSGWVDRKLLASESANGFFEVKLTVLKTKDWAPSKSDDSIALASFARHSLRSDDERWIVGTAQLDNELAITVWRLALAAT
jgi:hypothetical protein